MAKTWPAKDPSSVLDYVYRIPLDTGDSVATHALTVVSGTASIDSETLAANPDTTADGYGQDVTAFVSGGADGETAVFRIAWTTAGGRTDEDIITLPVAEIELAVLTGYDKPTAGHFTARYPAFASVPASTIAYWLTDAERGVDTSWSERDYAPALMSLAAHNMALAGLGADSAALGSLPAGVTRLKSGSFEVGMTDAAANARATGSFDATRYGQEYLTLLRRNKAGPLVSNTGTAPVDTFMRYPQGQA